MPSQHSPILSSWNIADIHTGRENVEAAVYPSPGAAVTAVLPRWLFPSFLFWPKHFKTHLRHRLVSFLQTPVSSKNTDICLHNCRGIIITQAG